MNIEQAIDELYSIRDFWLLPRHGDNGRAFEVREAVDMAVAALRTQQKAEKNEPLTLEELRGMDGKPVWVRYRGSEFWCLVDAKNPDNITLFRRLCQYIMVAYALEHGIARIYRRPPEKEET